MTKKRIYALCAIVGILIGSTGVFSSNVKKFADVADDSWYAPYVNYLTSRGIVKGMTETEYVPDGNFTVAESAAVITRYLKLEDVAQQHQQLMQRYGIIGSDKWYAGYIQLMHEAGIIDVTEYGCTITNGYVTIVDASYIQSPVKRYEFAAFIIRSFELDGTLIRTGDGTNGNEFISGGKYNDNDLELYIDHIKDYSSIPSAYNYYVLKAYYNGIFNGDNNGNFNPMNNLTRAEMAKVITVIVDQSQRIRIDVSGDRFDYVLSADDYTVYKNDSYLKYTTADKLLSAEIANGLTLVQHTDTYEINYTPTNHYPSGYRIDMRHYRELPSGYSKEISLSNDQRTPYINDFLPNDVFMLVLKEVSTGRAVDAYEIILNSRGITLNSHCNYLP